MSAFDYTFGVEIEFYLPADGTVQGAAQAVSSRLGQGRCAAEDYNHITREHWKIVTDRSLGDMRRGRELVSPILRGPEGLAQAEAAVEALTDYGCTVSRACGLHVHVGVPRGTTAQVAQFFRNLFKLYARFEPVIDRFMPPSRRANQNTYCQSMTPISSQAVDRAEDVTAIICLNGGSRYQKVNFQAYRSHSTVEFRQHSGTLDSAKVRNWTMLCLRMVDAAWTGRSETEVATPAPVEVPAVAAVTQVPMINRGRPGTRARIVGDLLLRPEGVTAAEARAATGWQAISIPALAQTCGLTIVGQRTGHTIRYRAVSAATTQIAAPTPTQTVTTDATLDELMNLTGASDAERAYFRNRTTNLSAPVAWAA